MEKNVGKKCSKVVHNKAIATFFDDGCKNNEALRLLTVLEQEDVTSSSNSSIQQSSIAKYNLAIIYFHQKKYQKAIETLKVLIDNLENIYESTAGKVGILFVHLLLTTNQPHKAELFFNVLLKTLNISLEISKDESFEFSTEESKGITSNCDVELRSMLQVIKIHLMILNKEPVNFPDEISKASQEIEVLRAYHSFLKRDFRFASQFLINNESAGVSEFYDIFLSNDMGVLQFSNKKVGIAENFFQCALRYDKQLYHNINSLPSHCTGE